MYHASVSGAVMWVLHTMLGMEERYLIVAMDEQRGRLLAQDIRLVRYFPSECLWEPLFRLYHFFWRVAMRNYG